MYSGQLDQQHRVEGNTLEPCDRREMGLILMILSQPRNSLQSL
jgi:hypothetical protein